MSFELKENESVAEGIRRVVRQEIDKGLEQLNGKGRTDRDEAVHDARKRFKKIRAVLRLVRNDLGDEVYRLENTCYRDAGRPLTEVRDAKVLVEAVGKLLDHFAGHVPRKDFTGTGKALRARQRAVKRRVLDRGKAFAKVATALEAARQRIDGWEFDRKGWPALEDGLKRVYKQGRDAMAQAAADRTVETFHEWRKQVKYLWHQLEILRPLWPEMMEELAGQAHELSGYLGDDHDLAVLKEVLAEDPDKYGSDEVVEVLVALIDRRRAELQQQAFLLGRRLYHDRPKVFADRIKGYWRAWRAEVQAPELA